MRSCRIFGISRQSIYQHQARSAQRTQQHRIILDWVAWWRKRMPRIGARKLYHLLKPKLHAVGIKLGRDGFIAYLKANHLLVKPLKRYIQTTLSHHRYKQHPNLYSTMQLYRPNQAWVSDITYVESDEGVHYLSLVTDAYSRKIVGHHLGRDMRTQQVLKALHLAHRHRPDQQALIHHSDRGTQYCSDAYQQVLQRQGIEPSTTDGGNCYQNALAERVNGILKQEFLLFKCRTFAELKQLVDESVEIYNEWRPHLSLGMKTPNQVHKKTSCEPQLAF